LPINLEALDYLEEFREKYPMWNEILSFLPQAKPVPKLSSWEVAGKVLGDSAWQLMQYTVNIEEIPNILITAESVTREILRAQE